MNDLPLPLPGDLLGKDLSCTICLKWFTEPLILPCGHNFCKPCLTDTWARAAGATCPECQAEVPGGQYIENTVLAKALESLKGFQVEQGEQKCGEHDKPLTLFWKPDGKLACLSCREASKEQSDQFLLVSEAVQHYLVGACEHGETLKLKPLWQRQKEQIASHLENRLLLQQNISLEFVKLHQFLHDREKRLMDELQEKGKVFLQDMQLNMGVLQEKWNQAKEILTHIQSRLYRHNSTSFLTMTTCCLLSLQEKAQGLSEGQLVCRELSLGQFKGPIQYAAWKEMKSVLSPGLSLITLDPRTAHPNLVLSADLTSVRHSDTKQALPGAPERFDASIAVLGAQGFTAGRHYWEVEVEKKPKWTLGVVKGSVNRKKRRPLSPGEGYWVIMLRNGRELKVLDVPPKGLLLRAPLTKIGVFLDYEGGQVSFYEAHAMSHIYTFRDAFAETLYPYFCPCLNEAGENSHPLRVFSTET
uniref:Tripartite motif containing 69 n=1 Tax=Nothoprocta perdicaria TaxID=30464 RepID=A0A8C6Z1K0_NOTPE